MKKLILLALCFIGQYLVHDFDSISVESFIPMEFDFIVKQDCNKEVFVEKDSLPSNINFVPQGNYKHWKRKIQQKKLQSESEFMNMKDSISKNKFLDSLSMEITNLLLNQIIPFWYGTDWDFNGYTNIPNQGEIACGYFVSTTLRDVGFRLNRYHFAQQSGWNASKSIQKDEELLVIRTDRFSLLKQECNRKLQNGLYFVGLDNHVGYLLLQNQSLYFIHSDYVSDKVIFERAKNSAAFVSNLYVICPITHNRQLTKDWVLNNEIPIIRG